MQRKSYKSGLLQASKPDTRRALDSNRDRPVGVQLPHMCLRNVRNATQIHRSRLFQLLTGSRAERGQKELDECQSSSQCESLEGAPLSEVPTLPSVYMLPLICVTLPATLWPWGGLSP
jgi:hypothetical protein